MLKRLVGFSDEFDIRLWILVMGISYVVIVSFFAARAHYTFYTNCWDLGIYSQSLFSTLKHGRVLYYTAELPGNPSGSLFGIHFSPLLFLLVPIYAIYPKAITLLVLRPIVIASGLLPLYLIAKQKGMSKRSLVFISFLYLIYLPVLFPFYNFDVEVFLLPIFLFFLYFLDKEDFLKSYLMILLSLMVNEFVPFITLTISAYILLSRRKQILNSLKSRKINRFLVFSTLIMLTSVLWFRIATNVITLHNPTAFETKWEWGELGSGPFQIVKSFILNPLKGLEIAGTDFFKKLFYVITIFGPVAFLSFAEPLPLIMASPWFAASMISINPQYYSVEPQYPSFFSAFIFYSAIVGWRKLAAGKTFVKHLTGSEINLIAILIIFNILTTISLIPVFSPKTDLLEFTQSDRVIHGYLERIPKNASISVMPEIFPHMSDRLEVYPYYVEGTDYILIDKESWWYTAILPRPAHFAGTWEEAEISDSYQVVSSEKGVYLLMFKK